MDDRRLEHVPFDLSLLGPPLATDRLETLVAGVMRRGDGELARRRGAGGVARVVWAWRRPLFVASGLAAAAAGALFANLGPGTPASPGETATVSEALGVPPAFAESVEGRTATAIPVQREKP